MTSFTSTTGTYIVIPVGIVGWDELKQICGLTDNEVEYFQHPLRTVCNTVVIELEYVCKDYTDTYLNFYAKKFRVYPRRCIRLLFFENILTEKGWDTDVNRKDNFLGYSVIRPTRTNKIGRTIIRPDVCIGPSDYVCSQEYTANLWGSQLSVSGFPHIRQDGDVTVCAHAACWMCFRYFSERYHHYREIYPYQITQLTSNVSRGRLLPSTGLNMEQVSEIFSRYGFFPILYDRRQWQKNQAQYERLLYYYIESGLPPVLNVPGHAVVAVGHSSDLRKRVGKGIHFSSEYLSGIIVNDDNSFPYKKIPLRNGMQFRQQHYDVSNVRSFIVPLPEKVHLAAEDVERLTLNILRDKNAGVNVHSTLLNLDDIVIRIYLTSSRAYKNYRRSKGTSNRLGVLYSQLPMPRLIWVSELSTREYYTDEKVLGEIVWDATARGEHHSDAWLLIHYPEWLALNYRQTESDPLPEGFLQDWKAYEIYRHNLSDGPSFSENN